MNANDPMPPGTPPAGSFDPARAAQLRSQALETFQGQMKKIERMLNGWLLFMMAIALFAACMFFGSTDTQSWILYGVLFLVGFNSTILLKLWYWILNNKIGVLREVRLLRLDLAAQKGSMDVLERIVEVEPQTRPQGLSKKERRLWFSLLIAMGVAIGVSGQWQHLKALFQGSRMTSQRTVTLNAAGTGRMETVFHLQNPRRTPIEEFTIYAGGSVSETQYLDGAASPYRDAAGRVLACRVEPAEGQNKRFVIQLSKSVPPHGRFILRSVSDVRADREGGVWAFSLTQNWGYDRNHYEDTVRLPAGAEVVSTTGTKSSQANLDGREVVQFEGRLNAGETWAYEVKYRLATGAPGQPPPGGR